MQSRYRIINKSCAFVRTVCSHSGLEMPYYSNKRCSAYLIFRATSAALIQGQRLFEGSAYLNIDPDKFTFSINYFHSRHTFYLLIFLWTDTKLIVNLELQEKFTQSFMIIRVSHSKNSGKKAYRMPKQRNTVTLN